jgi:hypothetical protein
MLVETRQRHEKIVYTWRLDKSRVADVTASKTVLDPLPKNTRFVDMDGAYDARHVYELVEAQGAQPIVKPRSNANPNRLGARGRALRWRLAHPEAWQRRYNRRPITESVNYALKRRFGERLWAHGMWAQRQEIAIRIMVYNGTHKVRSMVRAEFQGRES